MFVRVNQRVLTPKGEIEVFAFVETEHRNMAELYDDYAETGAIFGRRYYTRQHTSGGDYEVVDVGDTILADYVVSVQHMKGRLVDGTGRVIWSDQGAAKQ